MNTLSEGLPIPSARHLFLYWVFILVCTLAIIISLPQNLVRDYGIPLVAVFGSISAVMAALIAYSAATLRTDHDKKIEEDKIARQRKNLHSICRLVAETILYDGRILFECLKNKRITHVIARDEIENYRIPNLPELDTLISELGVFNGDIAGEIREIRKTLLNLIPAINRALESPENGGLPTENAPSFIMRKSGAVYGNDYARDTDGDFTHTSLKQIEKHLGYAVEIAYVLRKLVDEEYPSSRTMDHEKRSIILSELSL